MIPIHDDARRPFGVTRGPFSAGFTSSMSSPMRTPDASSHNAVPPPLPPPRFVPVDGPQPDHSDFFERRKQSCSESFFGGRSESNYGSFGQSWASRAAQEDTPDYKRRASSSTLTGKDEGYSSLSSHASSG